MERAGPTSTGGPPLETPALDSEKKDTKRGEMRANPTGPIPPRQGDLRPGARPQVPGDGRRSHLMVKIRKMIRQIISSDRMEKRSPINPIISRH